MDITPTPAFMVADECAAEMKRKLETLTPADMGFDDISAEELIHSKWKSWFDEESREA
jgi:hypothetical protein